MSRRQQISAVRRVKAATSRLEAQPYDFFPRRRAPRLSPVAQTHAWCQFSGTVPAATGTWPSLTPAIVNGMTLYRWDGQNFSQLATNQVVYNWRNVTWAANKTTLVLANGDGSWDIADQDC